MKEKTITSIIELAKHLHQNRYNRFNHTKTFDGNTPLDRLRSDFKIGFDVFGNSEQTYTYREKVQLAAEGHLAYQLLIQNYSSELSLVSPKQNSRIIRKSLASWRDTPKR